MIQKRKQMTKEADQEIEIPKSIITKVLKITFISAVLFFLNVGAESPVMSSDITNKIVIIKENELDLSTYPIIIKQRIHSQLVNEVDAYMKKMAPDTKINTEYLITLCQKYNLDIPFVLSQALLESHFGTRGKSLTTNSVFNVGSYDNGKIIYTYKTANESLEPFMQLLREKYLVNEKSISDLIQDKGYKNKNGYRFATSSLYEEKLRTLMININMQTSIKMYQEIINLPNEKIMAYFSPISENNDSTQFTASNTLK